MTPLRPLDHVRAVAVLLAGFSMLMLGMPGLDLLGPKRFAPGSKERADILEEPWGRISVGAADLNRAVREPIVAVLTPIQRPLRMAQSWGLYGGGPAKLRRLEIYVDGRLVFRSNDPEATWLEPALRYRRIRPVVDAHCMGKSKNTPGLMTWIVRRAREDFPEATHLRLQCTEQKRGGDRSITVRMLRVAAAPDWRVRV